MTDPLLTIDDATRAFRTSPKTIRRRLAAGEIAGAYKRPGDRGPEWVMPAASLVAAGFVPRPRGSEPTLPDDPVALATYWERRAVDAESAVASRREPEVDAPASRWRMPALLIALVLLAALAFLAGQRSAGDGSGDVQGFDTQASTGAVDDDRTPAGGAPPTTLLTEPAATEETPLAARPSAGPGAPTPTGAAEASTAASVGATSGTSPVAAPTPATHTVSRGESFWSVAAKVVWAAGDTSTGAIPRYWTKLLDANVDQLVQAGNPDLVHVGQVLVLSPAG